jgi:hypothetical protein
MNEQWRCKREATTLEHSGRSLNHHDRRSEAVVESHGEEAAVARSPPPPRMAAGQHRLGKPARPAAGPDPGGGSEEER